MQLMPATAKAYGADPHDPGQNVEAGAAYLRELLIKYDGDARRALAAYNAGPGAVDKYNGVPPYAETQLYVQKILGTGSYTGTRSVRAIIYRYTESDGTVTYSNVPRGAAAPSFR